MNERENRPFTQAQVEGLKEEIYKYIDGQFELCREIRRERNLSIDRSIDLAREGMEKRLDSMNEFRETLRDQAGKFVTRNELLGLAIGISTLVSIVVSIVIMLIKH